MRNDAQFFVRLDLDVDPCAHRRAHSVTLLQLLWVLQLLLVGAAGLALLRVIFRQPDEWRRLRAWVLAVMVLVGMLLGWRAVFRASAPGHRDLLERYSGLELPFWPPALRYHDAASGVIAASLSLPSEELARVPRGSRISASEARSLLREVGAAELHEVRSDAELESITRCRSGWYSIIVVDRSHGLLWLTLFYPTSSDGSVPCVAD